MSSILFLPPAIYTVAVKVGIHDSRGRRFWSAGAGVTKRWCLGMRSIRADTAAERIGRRNGGEFGPNGECDCDIPARTRMRTKRQSIQDYPGLTENQERRNSPALSNVGNSTNIAWHECPVGKLERQNLLNQKGCVIWITGLSGSGKSTLACTLSRELHALGYLSYVLDGDNLRHGLNKDLCFKAEDRAENIRRIGEVAKLFADAGVICIASLISPYRRDRDACRAMLPDSTFIEVYMDISLEVCESRDAKGLYKLAREGKIKGFTGVDDAYEPPLNCEIVIAPTDGVCPPPATMAKQVISYLHEEGFLKA